MKIYTLQHYSKTLITLGLTVGLGLAGINAAAASALESSPSFNEKYFESSRNNAHPVFADFNDAPAFTFNSGKEHSTSFASFKGFDSSHRFANFYQFDEADRHSAHFSKRDHHDFGGHFVHYGEKPTPPYHFGHSDTHHFPKHWEHWGGHTAVNPVPEPSEYLLMLCGLGLIGFMSMKRRPSNGFSAA